MTESHPYPVTVYTDRTIGLTVTAWRSAGNHSCWLVRFLCRNTQRKLLDQTAFWRPRGVWDQLSRWHPIRHRLIPPAALAAVDAWMVERAAAEVGK